MKLHLPCALRGALLACFALACAAPTWAENDVTVDETGTVLTVNGTATNAHFLKTTSGTEYVIRPDSATSSLATLNVISDNGSTEKTVITIEGSDPLVGTFVIDNMMVQDKKELHIKVADGTIVRINNINFTGKITYEVGTGAQIILSADDCAHNVGHTVEILGSGVVALSGGTIDATKSTSPVFSNTNYISSLGPNGADDIKEWCEPYLGAGSSVSFAMLLGAEIQVNGPHTGGGLLTDGFMLDWKASGGAKKIVADEPSVIIDPDTQVYRSGTEDNKIWNLHMDVSVQQLQSGKLGDINDAAYIAMEETDTLSFQGATLTSSATAVINGEITTTESNAVKLAPAAGTTLEFTHGDGALSNGNGLILSGGKGSTVILRDVQTAAPEKIEFTTEDTTLAIAGPEELTMNSANNTFLATSHLSKLDGGKLIYIGKETDAIGSLSNETGTVEIARKTALTTQKLTASTLAITKAADGSAITADSVQAENLEIADYVNVGSSLTADRVSVEDTITLGSFAKLTAGDLSAANVEMAVGSNLKATTLDVSGTLAVSPSLTGYTGDQGLDLGNISIVGGSGISATGTLTDVHYANGTLSTASIQDTTIHIIPSTSECLLSLGSASNVCITPQGSTTIADTVFTNNSRILAKEQVTLLGVTFGDDATVRVNGTNPSATFAGSLTWQGSTSVINGGATMLSGSSITVGSTSYEVTPLPKQVTIIGSANETAMTIDVLMADLTGQPTPTPEGAPSPVILTSTSGTYVKGNNYVFDYITDPGMVPYETFVGNSVLYVLRDESDRILSSLKTNDNATPAVDVLADFGMNGGQGVLFDLFNYLRDTSRATADRRQAALDAVVSGSVTMMADSQRRGVTDNINRLRNRVVQMGNPQGIEQETNIHAWISADGANSDVDQDGTYAGYEYQTWGGTAGVHADVGNFSFGAAVSAAYGDLSSHSKDYAEGDHDSVTLSVFARHQKGAWTQLGILSVGRNEIEMQRSITAAKNPGKGDDLRYQGDGDASGHTITAYYEAGYTFSLTEDNTQVIQPIASIMLTSARMGEYTETGTIGNAGLCTDTEDYFYGTVGIGARYQIVLGTNVEGRVCFGEVRAKLVQDFGDETNETSVFFSGAPNQTFTVRGADVGRTGFQIGAGLSIPVGVYTTLFADGDADFRSGATSVSGSVGVRVEF